MVQVLPGPVAAARGGDARRRGASAQACHRWRCPPRSEAARTRARRRPRAPRYRRQRARRRSASASVPYCCAAEVDPMQLGDRLSRLA